MMYPFSLIPPLKPLVRFAFYGLLVFSACFTLGFACSGLLGCGDASPQVAFDEETTDPTSPCSLEFDAGSPDSATDAGQDAGRDAGFDAGTPDAGRDAGTDAGQDAGRCKSWCKKHKKCH